MQGGRQPRVKSALLVFGVGICWALFTAQAQLVADGTTNVLDGVTTNIIGTITIGTNGPFTRLIVTNGATISNTGGTTIGNSANSNSLVVTGHGSHWNSASPVYIGESGAYNQLSILEGAVFSDGGANLGYLGGSGSNLVLVSGLGSLWTNYGSIDWGKGPGSQLVVSNGGAVFSYGGTIWNGRVSIAGTGSVWNTASLALGSVGVGDPNQMSVSGGGAISNWGSYTIGSQSHSNLVLVTDLSSLMKIGFNLQLGLSSGKANQFIVSNSAAVTVANSIIVASTNQRVIITGPGSLLTSQNDFYLGQTGYSNLLSVLDRGQLADATGYIGGSGGGPGGFNQALVSGTNTLWTNRGALYVGYSSARNQLVISNGATVCDTNGILGFNANTHSNTVVVTGPGSFWTNSSALVVGTNSSFNQLFVTNGGVVVSKSTYIGGTGSSVSNRVTVADSGSVLATSNLFVGLPNVFNRGNQLTVGAGAIVSANSLIIGSPGIPIGNALSVNGGNVIVTNPSLGGTLSISNYGTVAITSGAVRADYLNLGSSGSIFNFSGGMLQTGGTLSQSTVNVGNGTNQANFELLGGTHTFNASLVISSNATLKGAGTISGNVTLNSGGTFDPGSSIGQIVLNGNLMLSAGSKTIMELNAVDGTCDSIVGPTNLVYGGTLSLPNFAGVLTNGSNFRLFSASNYSGAFSALLPLSPGQGLKWNTNELNVDGVLRVFALQSPAPMIAGVQVSGTSILISASSGIPYDSCYLLTATNIGSSTVWEYMSTNRFDPAGNVIFNPPFSPVERHRFFRLYVE